MKALFPFTDFLWILQKEEYENRRYLFWLRRFFFRRGFVTSERIAYTGRAKLTLAVTLVLWFGSFYVVGYSLQVYWQIAVLLILWCVLIPVFVLIANFLLMPFVIAAHQRLEHRARERVRAHAPMKVVAIVGSYGKTTTKHFLYELVRHSYRSQMIPGTVNTTAGIAVWLLRELAPSTELLIVEMDAYHAGEIAASCRMTPPDIAIVTNVGEQHMARFKRIENLANAIGEVVTGSKPEACIIADARTRKALTGVRADRRTFSEVDTTQLVYGGRVLTSPELSASNRENLARALRAAELVSVPLAFVEDSLQHVVLPDRRQRVTQLLGYEGIDDSYNISLSTAEAGLAAARSFADAKDRKLLVVSAGIPELGPEALDGNMRLGEAVAQSADHVIVLNTMFAEDILRGLGTTPYTRLPRYEDFLAARDQFPPNEWILLLQPTLPDLYY
jgi:UDP-N-acetylmuramoyl-tripeptide--D-alanyl-D-alanine ligase